MSNGIGVFGFSGVLIGWAIVAAVVTQATAVALYFLARPIVFGVVSYLTSLTLVVALVVTWVTAANWLAGPDLSTVDCIFISACALCLWIGLGATGLEGYLKSRKPQDDIEY